MDEENLYILKYGEEIAGSIILNNEPEEAYYNVKWKIDVDYNEVIVVHTFVVHPKYIRLGIGAKLMNFAYELAKELNMKSIR
ncbi:MAG: GNAT family N-acetyltransferase, partial [Clostridium sp.]